MKIYPYNSNSQSAKSLAEALGIKRLKREGKGIKAKTLINWGCSQVSRQIAWADNYLNTPDCVAVASNKLHAFKALQGHCSIPMFTELKEEASKWLVEGVCKTVVCRTVLNGHSGQGIVLSDTPEALVDAPLYVQYIPKKHEYRVHVFQGKVLFVQQKKKREGFDNANFQIRNHQNGFIYAHQDLQVGEKLEDEAKAAIMAIGLDFGAVDIIYNEKQNRYFVLEINTAPGLQGETLKRYVEAFKELK